MASSKGFFLKREVVAAFVLAVFGLAIATSWKATEPFVTAWYERTDWYNSLEFAILMTFVTTMVMTLLFFLIIRPIMLWFGFVSRT